MFTLMGIPPGCRNRVEVLTSSIDAVRAEKEYRSRTGWSSLSIVSA